MKLATKWRQIINKVSWLFRCVVHTGKGHVYMTLRHSSRGITGLYPYFKGCTCGVVHYLRDGYSVTFEGPGKLGRVVAFQYEGKNHNVNVKMPKFEDLFKDKKSSDSTEAFEYETTQGSMPWRSTEKIKKYFASMRKPFQ